MVFFNKRSQAPASLALQRSHREPDTIQALYEDFKNKCYICGSKGPKSLNVEHFDEHRGNIAKKYDWNNLFYACSHCNAVKQQSFPTGSSNLLNCTDPYQKVDYWIIYRTYIGSNMRMKVNIMPNPTCSEPSYSVKITNTVNLLAKVFNGSGTGLKDREALNLSDDLQDELNAFKSKLLQYKSAKESLVRARLKSELVAMVENKAPFAAFKRWIIRDQGMSLEIPFNSTPTSSSCLTFVTFGCPRPHTP